MAYDKYNWVTGEVITADKLNHIEEGIESLSVQGVEMHRVIVTDSKTRNITDFKGTILIVKNGLDEFNSFTLAFDNLSDETCSLTIIFSFDCGEVKVNGLNGCQLRRFPDSVKEGDVWTVVYDKFYKTWDLASYNCVGDDREVMSFVNGAYTPLRIGWKHLSDLPTPPPFKNGLLAGTAFKPDGNALFAFVQLDDVHSCDSGSVPMYSKDFTLKTKNAVEDDDAINKGQLFELINGGEYSFLGTGESKNFVIPHNLGRMPKGHTCNTNLDSAYQYSVVATRANETYIEVLLVAEPPEGTEVVLNWIAF